MTMKFWALRHRSYRSTTGSLGVGREHSYLPFARVLHWRRYSSDQRNGVLFYHYRPVGRLVGSYDVWRARRSIDAVMSIG